jgi:hypothetical protein
MDDAQRQALAVLMLGVKQATDSGLFDEQLNGFVHPDVINQFSDAVVNLTKAEGGDQ